MQIEFEHPVDNGPVKEEDTLGNEAKYKIAFICILCDSRAQADLCMGISLAIPMDLWIPGKFSGYQKVARLLELIHHVFRVNANKECSSKIYQPPFWVGDVAKTLFQNEKFPRKTIGDMKI